MSLERELEPDWVDDYAAAALNALTDAVDRAEGDGRADQ